MPSAGIACAAALFLVSCKCPTRACSSTLPRSPGLPRSRRTRIAEAAPASGSAARTHASLRPSLSAMRSKKGRPALQDAARPMESSSASSQPQKRARRCGDRTGTKSRDRQGAIPATGVVWGDWKAFLARYFHKKVPQLKTYHAFRFHKDFPGTVFCRKLVTDEEEIPLDLLAAPRRGHGGADAVRLALRPQTAASGHSFIVGRRVERRGGVAKAVPGGEGGMLHERRSSRHHDDLLPGRK